MLSVKTRISHDKLDGIEIHPKDKPILQAREDEGLVRNLTCQVKMSLGAVRGKHWVS
jgi:hypothetical protein